MYTIMFNESWFDLEVNWDPFLQKLVSKSDSQSGDSWLQNKLSFEVSESQHELFPFRSIQKKIACDTDFQKWAVTLIGMFRIQIK